MHIDRKRHWQFLEDELRAETEVFNKKFSAKASFLLGESEDMFVGQFIEFKDGEMITKFPNSRNLPRKGEYLYSMILPQKLRNYHNWGDFTYRDIFNERYKGTECVCVWATDSDNPQFSIVAFRKVDLEYEDYIIENNGNGIILVFGPQRPPIEYLVNLQKVVEDEVSVKVSDILDFDYQNNDWSPQFLRQDNVAKFVKCQLDLNDTLILQGPPGTGKTYMIAELCNMLCGEGYSVLVTSLTNRALMEIAEKPALCNLLSENSVYKTNMSVDEHKELTELAPLKEIIPMPGKIVLSTYFITSAFAAGLTSDCPFDYVIMDEASQAILAMFAAAKKIGQKNLWVGDVKQLSPIVALNEDRIKENHYDGLINGLQMLTENASSPIYQLTKTFRLGQRAANYTGVFYDNSLVANESFEYHNLGALNTILHKDGGPSLILTDMPLGNYAPKFAIALTCYIVGCILNVNNDKKVSVLTCMKNTTRALQTNIFQEFGAHSNIRVDTIARIQGLTSDITIFFIPNATYFRTLEEHLFNVATSRAKEHTIIIADKKFLEYPTIKPLVRKYLERLKADKSIYIPAKKEDRMKIGQTFLLDD